VDDVERVDRNMPGDAVTTYEPGAVAEVTYEGRRVRAARVGSGWQLLDPVKDGYTTWTNSDRVTDVRPLAVLDLHDLTGILDDLNWAANTTQHVTRDARLRALHSQIEAQTKPTRIPEPGLWGIVKATLKNDRHGDAAHEFVNVGAEWLSTWGGKVGQWAELIDPVLVREGVES
jgi:hypothetical protein